MAFGRPRDLVRFNQWIGTMTAFTMIRFLTSRLGLAKKVRRPSRIGRRVFDARPACESLEDRMLLATGVISTLGASRLDSSFGVGGKLTSASARQGASTDAATFSAAAVALQLDGKIVVVGTIDQGGGNQNIAVARFQSNGSFDLSFGTAGMTVIGFDLGGNRADIASGLAIQPNGRIVVVGSAEIDSSGDRNFAVARLLTNGKLDTTFSGDGKQTVAFDRGGNRQDTASGVAVQADGKIVIVGTATMSTSGDTDFAIARLHSSGLLDSTFDSDGKQTVAIQPGSGLADIASSIAIDGGNRIIVAGSSRTSSSGGHDFAVVKLTTNGSLDRTFDFDGRATIAFDLGGQNDDRATSLGVQNGKIVVGGFAQIDGQGNDDFAITRLNSNGSLDRTFDGDGKATVSFDVGGDKQDRAASLAIQANGQIVLAGSVQMDASGDFDFAVVRLNGNGGRDTTFDGDGKGTIAFDRGGSKADFATGVVIQPNGRIVIAGRAQKTSAGDFEFALTRLFGLG